MNINEKRKHAQEYTQDNQAACDAEDYEPVYGDWRDDCVIAEMVYARQEGDLPDWALVIERFEVVDGAYLWIHRDTSKLGNAINGTFFLENINFAWVNEARTTFVSWGDDAKPTLEDALRGKKSYLPPRNVARDVMDTLNDEDDDS